MPIFDNKYAQRLPKLENLCLSLIVQFFDEFCRVFKESDSPEVQHILQLLVRRAGDTLFCILKEERKLKIEHLDLLISNRTTKLNIHGIDQSILPHVMYAVETHRSNILTFEAGPGDIFECDYQVLMSALRRVENLAIGAWDECLASALDDADPRHLPMPRILEAIGLFCVSLKNLKLRRSDTMNSHICYNRGIGFILKNCATLETINYRDTVGALYELHKNDLSSIRDDRSTGSETVATYKLKSLSASRYSYLLCDALEICAAVCPHVTSLHVDRTATDLELEIITSHFMNLQCAKLPYMTISLSSVTTFLNLRGSILTYLSLTYVPGLSTDALITSCPKLQFLKLWIFEVLTVDVNKSCETGKLPYLSHLKLQLGNFDKDGTVAAARSIIFSAESLKTLSLKSSTGLSSERIRSLNLLNISTLDVSNADITVHPLIELISAGKLEKLIVRYCHNIAYDDFSELKKCASGVQRNVTIHWESWPWQT